MKVLQINAVNRISSTGRSCYEISEYLMKKGNECVTAYSTGSPRHTVNDYIIGNKFDRKVHGLLSRISGKQGYFSGRATRRLLLFIDKFKPDIILLGNLHGNYINLPLLLKYIAKHDIATVAVLHDCWFYTGKCCHYTVDQCYKWQLQCGNCPSLKKYNKSWFFDRTKAMFEDKRELFGAIPRLAVVGVSDWITKEAEKSPVFENAREILRIYNWIDVDTFYMRDTDKLKKTLGLKDNKYILCVASQWNNEKGLDTIVQLSNKLVNGQKLIVIGTIKYQVKWGKNVICIPPTNSVDELAAYYSVADVLVQPSLEETFGKVSAEALACGIPIVCFNSTANPELVGEGCGIVVDIGDIEGMYKAINQILKNGKNFYRENCINFARHNFKKETNIEQYISLFERLIKNNR